MVFSSTLFIFVFLPITLLGYYILRGQLRNYWLLLVSLIFFGWSQYQYLWIILLNIVINYACAMLIDFFVSKKKFILFCSVFANLAILFYFKYFDFVIDSINMVTHTSFALREIVLPIGISFFTFQGMSYVIDVFREDVPVQKNIFKVGLYIVLFPQLIAGPIVRYKDIEREINDRKVILEDFSSGIERFILGVAKKAIIANTMAVMVDSIWNHGIDTASAPILWFGSVAYTLQIYFDFSGYSDMAIGLGRMFGFHFNENFHLPYVSETISEFWRRWHISLSSWFRDYVYIPLGGNRKNVYLNLAIVFLLTGVWHGASWHFILWGIWHGIFILIERYIRIRNKSRGVKKTNSFFRSCLLKIYTLFIVDIGWILFRADNISLAFQYIATMFHLVIPERVGYSLFWYLDRWTIVIMLFGILFASSLPTKIGRYLKNVMPARVFEVFKYILLLLLFYMALIRIVAGTYNPFIYFQF